MNYNKAKGKKGEGGFFEWESDVSIYHATDTTILDRRRRRILNLKPDDEEW